MHPVLEKMSIDPLPSPELALPEAGALPYPTEGFFDALADTLADPIARMPGGAAIDLGFAPFASFGEMIVHGEVWRNLARPQLVDKVCDIKAFVVSQSDPLWRGRLAGLFAGFTSRCAVLIDHLQRRLAFRCTRCQREGAANHQPVSFFHQGMAHVIKLAFLAIAIAIAIAIAMQPGIWVGDAGMAFIGAILSMEIPLFKPALEKIEVQLLH